MSDEIDEEALQRYVEWVEAGRVNPEVHDTPLGVNFVADRSSADKPRAMDRPEVMSFRAALSFDDVISSIYDGDIEAVNEVDESGWEEFLVIAGEALEDVGEEELREARSG